MTDRPNISSRKIKVRVRRKTPAGKVAVTINLTYRCNWSCRHCLQLCDLWKQPDSDLTMAQVERFCHDAAKLPLYIVRVSGGEPSLHPQFTQIVGTIHNRLVKDGPAWWGGLDTNTPEGLLSLPSHWTQISFPNKARHNAQLISPDEIGLRSRNCGKACRVQQRCGIGFDYRGWSFCLIAPNLQAMLGIERTYDGPCLTLDEAVCKHCVWSLSQAGMREINDKVAAGQIPWPSNVFKPGLRRLADRGAIDRTARSIGREIESCPE